MAPIHYDDLANHLEEVWSTFGLHDHGIYEQVNPTALERSYKAELFPDHGEPLTEHNIPPWVELSFVWGGAHQSSIEESAVLPLELQWNYTITLARHDKRNDHELVQTFHQTLTNALRTIYPDENGTDVLAVEVRRAYRSHVSREPLNVVLYASGTSDIGDVLTQPSHDSLRTTLREEFMMVSTLLRAFAESFNPGTVGGYRSVESA